MLPAWDLESQTAYPGPGKLMTGNGNTGSLCEQQPLKALRAALRAPCGPIPQYKILHIYIPVPVLLQYWQYHISVLYMAYAICRCPAAAAAPCWPCLLLLLLSDGVLLSAMKFPRPHERGAHHHHRCAEGRTSFLWLVDWVASRFAFQREAALKEVPDILDTERILD
jgi:hypothetical protein